MPKTSKIIITVIILAAIAGIIYSYYKKSNPANQILRPIRVGVLAPLTGGNAVLGERIRNGMELAKEDILKQDDTQPIEIIYEDACLPKDAVSAMQKLVEINKIDILGGSFCLIGLVPVLPIAEQNNIIVFNTAANPNSVLNKPFVFSTNISIQNDAKQLANYAAEKIKAQTAAIVYLDTPFGQDYNKYLSQNFEQNGSKILFSEKKAVDTTDFRTDLIKIKALNPDMIFVIHHGQSLGIFFKQTQQLGLRIPILGHYEAEDPTVIEYAGNAAVEGFVISSSEPKIKTDAVNKFMQIYLSKFAELPDVLATNAYDALHLEIAAYKKCNGDFECMKQHLRQVKDYPGVSGSITINPDGSSDKPTIFKIVKDGQFVKLDD